MKLRRFCRFSALFISMSVSIPSAFAVSYQWDANGSTQGLGGSGSWDSSSWDDLQNGSNDGSDPTQAITWNDTFEAVFAGTAGTVTLSSTNLTLNKIRFTSSGYSISGTGSLTLAGINPTIENTSDASISATLTGSSAFAKTGSGTLELAGANNYTGLTTIHAGTVKLGHNTALGSTTDGTIVNANATLELNGKSIGAESITLNDAILSNAAGNEITVRHLVVNGTSYIKNPNNWLNLINTTGSGKLIIENRIWSNSTASYANTGGIEFRSGQCDLYGQARITGGPISITGGTFRSLSNDTIGNDLPVSITAGIWEMNGNEVIGSLSGSGGEIKLGSYTLTTSNSTDTTVGSTLSGTGKLYKSGTGKLTITNANTYSGGTTIHQGILALSGANASVGTGAVTVDAEGHFDFNGKSVNQSILNGGELTTANGGNIGTTTLNQGGRFTNTNANSWVNLSGNVTGTGDLTLDGKFWISNNPIWDFSGNLILNGGQFDTYGSRVQLRNGGGVIVNGGLLNINGTATLHSLSGTGGRVQLGGTTTLDQSTDGQFAGVISGNGTWIKTGTGHLTLAGVNTFSGEVSVQNGTLTIASTGSLNQSSSFTLANTGTLDVAATGLTLDGAKRISGNGSILGHLHLNALTAKLIPSPGKLTIHELSFGAAGSLDFAPGDSSIEVTNLNALHTGDATHAIEVNVGTTVLAPGTYPLIQFSGAPQGVGLNAFYLNQTPGGAFNYRLSQSANSIDLIVETLATVWTGALNNQWNLATMVQPKNWSSNGAPSDYLDDDDVLFNDSASRTDVSITQEVWPTSVVFQNQTKDYTVTGTFGIGGTTGLTKSENGKVTISNTNSFTGEVIISGGILSIPEIADFDTPCPIGAGSEIILNGGQFEYTGATGSTDRTFQLNHVNSSIAITQPSTTLSVNYPIVGVAGVVKEGQGTLALNDDNTYTGTSIIRNGSVLIGHSHALGDTAKGTEVLANASIDLNGRLLASEPITLNQGSLINSITTTAATTPGAITLTNVGQIGGPGDLSITGVISGSGRLLKTGTGTLTLDRNHTYSGNTTIAAGTLKLSGGGNSPTGAIHGSVTVEAGATFDLAAADVTGYGTGPDRISQILLNGGTLAITTLANQTLGSCVITMNGGHLTGIPESKMDFFAGDSALVTQASAQPSIIDTVRLNLRQGSVTFTVADGPAATDLDIHSVLSGNALVKNGNGSMVVRGTNTYTGTTTIEAGTFTILGDQTAATGVMTVKNAGTILNGSGHIGGNTIIETGAKLDLANQSAGNLTFHRTLDIHEGATLAVDVVNGHTADQLVMNSGMSLVLNGTLEIHANGHTWTAGDAFDITNADTISGTPTLSPATPGSGLVWDTSELLTKGIIRVAEQSATNGYDAWASAITDPAQRGRDADPDGDGFTNQQEFLFGTSPVTNNAALSTAETSSSGIIIRWKQRVSGASYQLQQSLTLSQDWAASSVTPVMDGSEENGYQPMRVEITTLQEKAFFRILGNEN